MNDANVKALYRLLVVTPKPLRDMSPGDLAEYLASRGCLGPASQVLTPEDVERHGFFNSMEELKDVADVADDIERIAQGKGPPR